MKITLVEPRGFCMGVCRSLKMLDEIKQRPVYVLHEIVHNDTVVESYQQKGYIFVEDLSEVPDGATLVFSAHGVSKRVEEQASQKKLHIIDTTCPFVQKVHDWVKKLEQDGRAVLLIGKKNHVEVMGSIGQLMYPQSAYIISNQEDVNALPSLGKVGIATQTTLSQDETEQLIGLLTQKYPDHVIQSGICQATTERQNALKAACTSGDTVLVVGDKKSSNCMRLVELAQQKGCKTYLIEQAKEVLKLSLSGHIVITSAASAPEHIVQEICRLLQGDRH